MQFSFVFWVVVVVLFIYLILCSFLLLNVILLHYKNIILFYYITWFREFGIYCYIFYFYFFFFSYYFIQHYYCCCCWINILDCILTWKKMKNQLWRPFLRKAKSCSCNQGSGSHIEGKPPHLLPYKLWFLCLRHEESSSAIPEYEFVEDKLSEELVKLGFNQINDV